VLRRRKPDWFAVVATDLFCGVLAAVIILDAVAPKEESGAGSEILLTLTYKQSPKQPNEPLSNCQVGGVVFQFRDASRTHNTLGGIASLVDDKCRVETFLANVNFEKEPKETVVVVAQYAGELEEATVLITGRGDIKCSRGSPRCPIF
jgi:hypothetical protein